MYDPSGNQGGPVQHMQVPYPELVVYDGAGLDGAFERMGTSEDAVLKAMENDVEDTFMDSCVQQSSFVAFLHTFHKLHGLLDVPSIVKELPNVGKLLTTPGLVDFTIPEIFKQVTSPSLTPEDHEEDLALVDDEAAAQFLSARGGYRFDVIRRKKVFALVQQMADFVSEPGRYCSSGSGQADKSETNRYRICMSAAIIFEA